MRILVLDEHQLAVVLRPVDTFDVAGLQGDLVHQLVVDQRIPQDQHDPARLEPVGVAAAGAATTTGEGASTGGHSTSGIVVSGHVVVVVRFKPHYSHSL